MLLHWYNHPAQELSQSLGLSQPCLATSPSREETQWGINVHFTLAGCSCCHFSHMVLVSSKGLRVSPQTLWYFVTLQGEMLTISVVHHRATLTTSTRLSPETCCVPPPVAPTDTVSVLSPLSTTAPYLPVSLSTVYIKTHLSPPPVTTDSKLSYMVVCLLDQIQPTGVWLPALL